MATKSIGSAGGRDYATIALWAAYVNALVLIAANERGECYNDSEFTTAANITIGGWTNLGSFTVTLTPASGQGFRDNASVQTNALRYNQANGVGLSSSASYASTLTLTTAFTVIDGLQIKTTDNASQNCIDAGAGPLSITFQNNIVYGKVRNVNFSFFLLFAADLTPLIQNNVFIVTSASGCGIEASKGGTWLDNTIVSSGPSSSTGIKNVYAPRPLVKNTAVAGFTTDYSGTADGSSTNNATDLGAFGGTNYGTSGQVSLVATTEWQSVTAASEDLRLKSTSAKLKDNGVTAGPTNDIAGTTRPQGSAYDIGAWELVSGMTTGEMAAAIQHGYNMPRGRMNVIGYDI